MGETRELMYGMYVPKGNPTAAVALSAYYNHADSSWAAEVPIGQLKVVEYFDSITDGAFDADFLQPSYDIVKLRIPIPEGHPWSVLTPANYILTETGHLHYTLTTEEGNAGRIPVGTLKPAQSISTNTANQWLIDENHIRASTVPTVNNAPTVGAKMYLALDIRKMELVVICMSTHVAFVMLI